MPEQKSSVTNTSDLRRMLLETIEAVKDGTMEPAQARTIAALSTTVLHSAKLDLDHMRFCIANEKLGEAGVKVLSLVTAG